MDESIVVDSDPTINPADAAVVSDIDIGEALDSVGCSAAGSIDCAADQVVDGATIGGEADRVVGAGNKSAGEFFFPLNC